ncbi:MAG: sulfatase-like hydrolase/transferase [Deltaproteobacteria bacterium]|nr:sulfatase-like hydrolase/transferase [Deltaproteobacteria bacterium]
MQRARAGESRHSHSHSRSRRTTLGAAARVTLAAALLCCRAEDPPPQPVVEVPPTNVLLITIDTLRPDALGAYSGVSTSPTIDRLARDGALFEHVLTSSPSTLPSHAAILTGKHPYAHGARSNHGYVLSPGNRTLAEALSDAGYVTGAETAAAVIGRRQGVDQGFQEFRDIDSHDAKRKVASHTIDSERKEVEFPERHAVDISDKGIQFLRRHGDGPFFLWLHYFDPHRAYAAPREFASRFPKNPYHAEVAFTDYAIGLLIDELERLGLADRTLVVLTSDHGESLGQHGEMTHSHLIYDATMRVPLIFWGASELPRGRRVPTIVRTVDIAPTILDWLGQPPLEAIQGVSLGPILRGESPMQVPPAYGESIEAFATFGTSMLRFIQIGPWKYIHKVNPELYQVVREPGEKDNLAANEPKRVVEMRAQLETLLREAPPAPHGSEVEADAELMAQLHALGYVGDSRAPTIDDELATLELSGMDPNDTLEDLLNFAKAYGALNNMKQPEAALVLLDELAERHPNSVPIMRARVATLNALEREDEARAVLYRALELAPDDLDLQANLIALLRKVGNLEEAEEHALHVLALSPCHTLGLAHLGGVLREMQRYAAQGELLSNAVERCDSDGARNEYAYFLATCPDASQRDGGRALDLAKRITENTAGILPDYIDTLAAAYAETGDFERAIAIQRQAIEALEARDLEDTVMEPYRARLAEFEAHRPIRHK